ncbi:fumarate hydratase [Acidaminobacter sp. JC074]|uniref:fumarate hydratase n=1 Tax=Acidaminobacter sp. JC074 TaxID=2530199 RepID=UPI001F0FD282|nr:fumarate hydratase [Acidaminobacter sp. JC074]MCH4890709.1 fumarate hydratase [Acidaminobacter sp. JC074]
MREISVETIIDHVKDMCIESNFVLSEDIKEALDTYKSKEVSETGKNILFDIIQNAEIAESDRVPMCQDTGMAVVFVEIGQEVYIKGGLLEDAINEGIRRGYSEGYLRKSVVKDPLERVNTKDNTPGVIHYEIVSGDQLKITVAPKGFGSENMSRMKMLKPSDGIKGVKDFVLETVSLAGPNPCPPIVVGVGIGGTIEKAALIAKKSLMRDIRSENPLDHICQLEKDLLEGINKLGIGPQGLGGLTTSLGVNVEVYPTHIAGLPVVVNINCHATRHMSRII